MAILTVTKKRRYTKKKKDGLATKGYVKNQIARNIENKFLIVDMAATFPSIPVVWQEINMFNPTEGGQVDNRIGRSVRLKGIDANFIMQRADATNILRIVVFTASGQTTTPLSTIPLSINYPIVASKTARANVQKLLYDKYFYFATNTNEFHTVKIRKWFKTPIIFNWGDDSANYPDRKLYFCMISDSAAIPHVACMAGYAKFTFEDG